jgi:type III pantothenate kinase
MKLPRLIAVDIGNSSTKIGWFEAAADSPTTALPILAATRSFVTNQPLPADLAAGLPTERCRWHIASVHREGTRLLTEWVKSQRSTDEVHLLSNRDLPIATDVEFPDRVGLDRLAAAVAANVIREPDRPAIVIDAGSAITVDLVTAAGAFSGGVILPGFKLSAQALASGTDLLPLALLEPSAEPPPVLGKNTPAAIKSGLFWGAVGAVREIVARMVADLASQASGGRQPPEIFVTGGDLRQLATHIGGGAKFVPNMVLCGIAVAASSDLSKRV